MINIAMAGPQALTVTTLPPYTRFWGIDLSDGVRPRHLVAFMILVLMSSGYAGAMSALQPGLLQVMGIDPREQAQITGYLGAVQEIVMILSMGLFGACADRFGRRPLYVFGFLVSAVGFACYPFARSVVELAACRVVVALGGGAMFCMMVTIIADYTRDSTRGHANGLQGFVAVLGAFMPPLIAGLPAAFVGGGASEIEAQRLTFVLVALLCGIGAVIAAIGLAPRVAQLPAEAGARLSVILRDGALAAREPGVALSYGAAFISRGDLAVTTAFMVLWLVQFGAAQGMPASEAMASLAAPRLLATVCGALFGAIFIGWLADRIGKVSAVAVAAGLASAAYLGMGLVDDPTRPWVFALLGLMGVAEISAFVSSQALVGQRARRDRRGAIIGFFSVCGAAGILVGTAGGGLLFANIRPTAPFVLFGFLNLAVFLWALALRRRESRGARETGAEASTA